MPHPLRNQIDPVLLDSLVAAARDQLGHTAAIMFGEAMRRTLSDAVVLAEDGTAFVLTGDIPAMWLRDSAAQMRPYVALAHLDDGLADLVAAIVRRQWDQLVRDPYANAFNNGPTGAGHQGDQTAMTPWTWERKYEVDSLAFPIQLAHQLWLATGRRDHLDATFAEAARRVIETIRTEQDHTARSDYSFERTEAGAGPLDTLTRGGQGSPVAVTGMTWSAFRPSDDACTYHYNVPGNLFAAASLRALAELAEDAREEAVDGLTRAGLAADARTLAEEIEAAVATHARGQSDHGTVWAYEVDGLGHQLLTDDANMPSLLSLPLTGGIDPADPTYRATRDLVLSRTNPTYAVGATGDGVGSPHTPPRYVWPIATAVRGLTAPDREEALHCLELLVATQGARGRMSESYHVDDPGQFTREWFSWADSMFCELVLHLLGHHVPDRTTTRAERSAVNG
ncbi:glycoside hydrolase family 125 protein [Ruania halotolerans]|uniref:glycoside hydrolase family 125 protein n=1 Tax=Ruania halotolerans TaxID=2897773 RepID=UPI001E59338E|nr:glycoside hydrolase family 125 protein [Ruania halotolerans]UFU06702.1 glycoside hydrolase family 125 protein [Ruania halotolerans]